MKEWNREEAGKKTSKTMKQRYGENIHEIIGRAGGKAGDPKTKGFASDKVGKDGLTGKERAKIAGAKGGAAPRRGKYE